ncbi:anti-sigma-I factor RsgI [Clostridium gelidum]|uniref:Anti-sigma-I factor RsgI n=1 Tax=Clostridium gelidum TaxID=704125 RepID=A0ABM7T2G5_9CLOT|nr:anti-sigma factor [Clostridium gelidum]BCZ46108.1 anti-sigma-I factor RsgI [Clostridium gelidum]
MNKGMIMEVKRNYAIALNDEGFMEKITSKQNLEVGQKIFYFEDDVVNTTASRVHRHNNLIKAFGSIAALFLLVFTFFNPMNNTKAYAVVSLDINPSIQIEADSNQKIIKVEGVNIDGKNIDFSDIKNISLDDGIDKIKEKLVEKNYLDTNREVLVGIFIENGDNSAYADNITEAINSTFNTETVTYIKGNKEGVDEAKAKGISLGRYEASLVADEETKNIIDKAPVKDITSSIKDKPNVSQWQAGVEKLEADKAKPDDVPVVKTNPEVKSETPGTEKPPVKVPENTDPRINKNTDGEQGKDNNTKPGNNGVLELIPEAPPKQEGKNDASTSNPIPSKDSSIIIAPDNGTIENKTTSGKIQEDTNKISEQPAKTGETLVNKDTKN